MKKSTLFKAVLLILLIGSASYFFVSESVNVKHWINGLCIGLLAGDLTLFAVRRWKEYHGREEK